MAISGVNFVRFSRHGLQSIRKSWKRLRDQFEVRRYALNLKWWDQRHSHPPGYLIDMTYESIKSLPGSGIYELRIHDTIGDHDNIRVVFLDPPQSWRVFPDESRPMPIIWVLEALQKKSQSWSNNDISRFRASRLVIQKRFYEQ